MGSSVSTVPQPPNANEAVILPTLQGIGYGNYAARPSNFILSFLLHTLAVAAILIVTQFFVSHQAEIRQTVITLVAPSDEALLPSKTETGGGGGGGDRSKLDVSKGRPPKSDMNQITPPTVVVRNDTPKLTVEQTIAVPPDVKLPTSPQIGDPLSNGLVLSNGTGAGSGIGVGYGGGTGSGNGRGLGPGSMAGTGGGIFRVGGGVSPPKATFAPDPEYSEEARKAKYQGTVVLFLIVGPDGRPRDIRVARSLGMGLDEKAIEAVRRWRFEPAQKDGRAVAVQINVEVNFNLY